uniref:Uncharacterized protein n=1 Tax=Lutzomyia longipalpis TaxID=7200 RepID=A0A1B0CG24_LUTLO
MHKKAEVHINVPQDVLTAPIAGHILSSLIKFLAVRRQQIPFSYQTFISLVHGMSSRTHEASCWSEIQMEKQKELARNTAQDYEYLFRRIEYLFQTCHVQEVAFFLGATPLTPKEVWHVVLPEDMRNHTASHHSRNSQLMVHQTIRAIATHEELMENLGRQFYPTNMFCQFKIAQIPEGSVFEENYERKDLWSIPGMCHTTKIILENTLPDSAMRNCCGNLRIHGDSTPWAVKQEPKPGEWYSLRRTIKGFKEAIVKGKSIWNN